MYKPDKNNFRLFFNKNELLGQTNTQIYLFTKKKKIPNQFVSDSARQMSHFGTHTPHSRRLFYKYINNIAPLWRVGSRPSVHFFTFPKFNNMQIYTQILFFQVNDVRAWTFPGRFIWNFFFFKLESITLAMVFFF